MIDPHSSREILSVSHLNRRCRQLLETQLPMVWVEGEISNLAHPSSGHWYFTLKDDQAQVRCAMFKNRNQAVTFSPEQGQHVLLRARASLYEGRGDYQLIAEHMEEAGLGRLQREFEALKKKLASEGLFDPDNKRPLPTLPQHVAVITSPTGAAIRDILAVLQRRFPACKVTVVPAPVQGREAAGHLREALALALRANLFDAIIIGRGGGSLEDLWAFNDEALARAIAASPVPIISAVGHEIDFTIADFVADVRAPTPSVAAELLVPDRADWLRHLQQLQGQLIRNWQNRYSHSRQRLEHLRQRLRHPRQALQVQAQRIDGLELQLRRAIRQQLDARQQRFKYLDTLLRHQHPAQQLRTLKTRLKHLRPRLSANIDHILQQQQQRLSEYARLLNNISPLNTLERGYAIVTDSQAQIVKSAADVQPGKAVQVRLGQGQLQCRVESVED